MQSREVVVVGSINSDVVLRVAQHPSPGETVLATSQSIAFGGKGANQAVAAAWSGAKVRLVGAVGDDAGGLGTRQNLADAGIDTALVRTVPAPTGAAYITVSADGENSIVVVVGANAALTVADIEEVTDVLATAGVVLLQLEIPIAVVERAAHVARRVILNAAPAYALSRTVLEQVDILIVNEGEAAALLGSGEATDVRGLTERLLSLGPTTVVVTLGGRGAAWRTGEEYGAVPAPSVDVVDTTGAGDAFVGAFAACIVAGGDVAASVQAGVLHASWATTFAGAQQPASGHAR